MSHSSRPHGIVHESIQARTLEWQPFPSPGDLRNPGIEPRSPTLQADYLPAGPSRKSKNTRVGSLSLLQQIFLTQESNQSLLQCRWILYQQTSQGTSFSPFCICSWGRGAPQKLLSCRSLVFRGKLQRGLQAGEDDLCKQCSDVGWRIIHAGVRMPGDTTGASLHPMLPHTLLPFIYFYQFVYCDKIYTI